MLKDLWDQTFWAELLLWGLGCVLVFSSSWVARLCVPVALCAECPKCRFDLEHFRADRCPECGIFLGEDFHAPPKAGESEPTDS